MTIAPVKVELKWEEGTDEGQFMFTLYESKPAKPQWTLHYLDDNLYIKAGDNELRIPDSFVEFMKASWTLKDGEYVGTKSSATILREITGYALRRTGHEVY